MVQRSCHSIQNLLLSTTTLCFGPPPLSAKQPVPDLDLTVRQIKSSSHQKHPLPSNGRTLAETRVKLQISGTVPQSSTRQ
ncbi:hypothetical protein IWX49DRAFT_275265 [Phyllosticta citricarpa]